MIVAQVGTVGGGAGHAALKIHRGLREAGISSRYFVADPTGASAQDDVTPLPRRLAPWNSPRALLYRLALKAYTVRRPRGSGLFSYTSLPLDSPFPFDLVRPDILHLHWIAQGIDYRTFFDSLPPALPIVWTLHDMEPFTGGCHQAGSCDRYKYGCGWCPQLNGLRNPRDLSAITSHRKQRRYGRLTLGIAAVGRSILEQAQAAPVLAQAREFALIPNGIDVRSFMPRDRAASRAALDIPPDAFVLAFGAVELGSPYKGLDVLFQSLARLPGAERVLLLLFGGALPPGTIPPVAWRHAGFETDPGRLSTIYSAADVCAVPSRAESFGQIGLEALACGTPVVGSRVGGIPDYVIDGRTGLLFETGDADDLAAKLESIIDRPEARRAFGAAGPALVRERFSLEAVVRSYLALYDRLLAG